MVVSPRHVRGETTVGVLVAQTIPIGEHSVRPHYVNGTRIAAIAIAFALG